MVVVHTRLYNLTAAWETVTHRCGAGVLRLVLTPLLSRTIPKAVSAWPTAHVHNRRALAAPRAHVDRDRAVRRALQHDALVQPVAPHCCNAEQGDALGVECAEAGRDNAAGAAWPIVRPGEVFFQDHTQRR